MESLPSFIENQRGAHLHAELAHLLEISGQCCVCPSRSELCFHGGDGQAKILGNGHLLPLVRDVDGVREEAKGARGTTAAVCTRASPGQDTVDRVRSLRCRPACATGRSTARDVRLSRLYPQQWESTVGQLPVDSTDLEKTSEGQARRRQARAHAAPPSVYQATRPLDKERRSGSPELLRYPDQQRCDPAVSQAGGPALVQGPAAAQSARPHDLAPDASA